MVLDVSLPLGSTGFIVVPVIGEQKTGQTLSQPRHPQRATLVNRAVGIVGRKVITPRTKMPDHRMPAQRRGEPGGRGTARCFWLALGSLTLGS